MTFQNKKILVAGLGGTGISMIAYLRKNGAEVAAYDAELKPERVSQIGKMFDGLVFYTGRLKDALDNGFDIRLTLADAGAERQNIETVVQRIFQTTRVKHQSGKHLTDLRHALRFQLRIISGNLRTVFAQIGNH